MAAHALSATGQDPEAWKMLAPCPTSLYPLESQTCGAIPDIRDVRDVSEKAASGVSALPRGQADDTPLTINQMQERFQSVRPGPRSQQLDSEPSRTGQRPWPARTSAVFHRRCWRGPTLAGGCQNSCVPQDLDQPGDCSEAKMAAGHPNRTQAHRPAILLATTMESECFECFAAGWLAN